MFEQQVELKNYYLIFHQDNIILQKDYTPLSKLPADFDEIELLYCHIIGEFAGKVVIAAEWPDQTALPSEAIALPLRAALERMLPAWYGLIARAIAIIRWDKHHLFCGHCGIQTEKVDHLFEKRCLACGLHFYPRISPSVIVLIERDDYILMARSPHFKPGIFGLIAGFVEAGEGLEDAVHREVAEEVGITIHNLRYVGSQAWPFPDSLVVAFRAHYASGELLIDETEIETAGWYHVDHLPGLPSSRISIARKLIDDFMLEKGRNLP